MTTVVNAYLRPACRAYLRRLADAGRRGAGDDLGRRSRAGRPTRPTCRPRCCSRARRAACGPAAAAAAASGFPGRRHLRHGRHAHRRVPGRSTACPTPAAQRTVAGFPVRLPSLDVHTIGAGGGSIARIDAGRRARRRARERRGRPRAGLLRARRDRADGHRRRPGRRADPGRRRRSPGSGALDVDAAAAAALRVGRGRRPTGVIAVVDAAMEQALRAVSVERGVDPRGWRWSPSAGPARCTPARLADALGMAGGDRAAAGRRAVGGRDPGRARAGRRWCGRGRTPADHAGLDDARVQLAADARRCRGWPVARRSTSAARLPVRRAEPRADGAVGRRRSAPSTSGATATPGRATPSRSWRCGRRPGRARRSSVASTCPSPAIASGGVGPARPGRARLHGLGAGRLVGRRGTAGALVVRRGGREPWPRSRGARRS